MGKKNKGHIHFDIDTSEFEAQMEKMEKRASELEKGKNISLEELFHNDFVMKYGKNTTTFNELMQKLDIKNEKDLEEKPEQELDMLVRDNTIFYSFEEMQAKATELYMMRYLGF